MATTSEPRKTPVEIPVVYPSLEDSPRYFVVSETGVVQTSVPEQPVLQEAFYLDRRGSASVSSVPIDATKKGARSNSVIATALTEQPRVLAVHRLPEGGTHDGTNHAESSTAPVTTTLFLDLSKLRNFGTIVKVQAFASNEHASHVVLLVVDETARILSLDLDATHPSIMVPVSVHLQRAELTEFAVAAAPLRSSMLCILDPRTILLALNPFLVAVHLAVSSPHTYNDGTVAPANTTTTTVWSKTQCQERRTAVGSIFSKGVDLVVGRLPPCIDMAPVTALCVADNDPRHVISFHTDGVLRHWYWDYSPSHYRLFSHNSTGVNSNRMEPKCLVEPKCVASQVPPSSTWHAQDSNAVALTARVYGESRLAVALHIRTYTAASIEPENDTGSNGNDLSCSLLLVLDGPATNMRVADEDNWQATRLHVPHQAKSLVSMAFDPHSTKGQLQAVFTTMRTTTNNSTAPLYLQYPPSMLSMVSPKPVIANQEFLLPEEDWFPPLLPSTLTKTAEDRLEQVDRAYLIHLFRPTGRMPPLAMHVRRVLARLVPDQQARSLTATTSLEVETVRMMHAWRLHEETLTESSPVHKRHKTSNLFPPTTPGGSLYETLLGASEQGQETPSFPQSPQRQLETGTVQAHIRRWNVLLAQLSAEERQAREPLRVEWGIVGDKSNTTSAAAVVVRSSTVSVVKQVTENIDKDHEFLHKIDALFAACKTDTTALEQKVSETVAAAATLTETTLESLMGSIHKFSRSISLLASVHLEEVEEWVEQLQSPGNVSLACTYRHDPYALVGAAADAIAPLTHDENRNTTGQLLSCQQRLAVTALAVQSMEHFRRVLLGRLLVGASLPCDLGLESLLRVYLQATNALWVASQHVDMRYPRRPSQSLGNPETTGTASVLAPWNIRMQTTAMDSFLIHLAGQCNAQEYATASENTARLAKISVDAFLGFGYKQKSDNNDLPELGALPPTTGSLTNEAALALRLLAVHVASPDEKEDDQVTSLRKEVSAECLLIASSSVKASKADEMVSRAIKLLKFNAENMSTSMKYVQLISRRLKGSQKHHHVLADYLDTAIRETPTANHSDACKLWALLFDISVAVNDWPAAFTASQSGPDPSKRLERLKRFVRVVVDAGSLHKLLAMCSTTASLVDGTVHLDAVVNCSELYEIAAETLSDNAGRDIYSMLALDTEPLSDYSGALYALHESQHNWKRAAESLLARVRHGKRAIAKQSESATLPPDTYARRESLIVEDVALSTAGCDLALKQTEDAYVASAKPSSFTEHISPAFNTAADLSAQAIVTMSLKALFYDKLGAFRPFAIAAIAEDSLPHEHMVDALDHLFTSGFYHAGLMVAEARCKLLAGHPYGINPFNEAVTHLLCTYLVPLSSGALAAEGQRPSLLQIASAFDAFKVKPAESVPSLLALRSGTRASGMYFGAVRSGTGALTHALTVGHAALDQSLAIEVAACVLDSPECCSKIPAWLEVLLVCGTRKGDESGLFSKRLDIQDAADIYPGHPAALLDLYLKRGLYANACHIASSALRGSGTLDRQTLAPSRLPEKGDMDIVPYAKIDVLWNLIEDALKSEIFDKAESEEMLSAREAMEKALEKHFQLLRVSEMGLMSARAVL